VRDELKLFPFRLAEDLAAGEVLRIKLAIRLYTAGDFRVHPASIERTLNAILLPGHPGCDHRAAYLMMRSGRRRRCGTHCGIGSSAAGQ